MKRGRSLRILSIIALVISIMGLIVAYAAISNSLHKKGNLDDDASWNIKFDNLKADTKGKAIYNLPTISDTSLNNFSVNIQSPGDTVVLQFDVVNKGSLDAILSTLLKRQPVCVGEGVNAVLDANQVCSNLKYSFSYQDGSSVAVNDLLMHDSSKTIQMQVSYPADGLALNGKVTINGLDVVMIYNQN